MATALLQHDQTATVTATYTRVGDTLRVTFHSYTDDAPGFTHEELDALEVAISHARSHMLEHQADPQTTLTVVRPEDDTEDLRARYRTQLRHMQPVAT